MSALLKNVSWHFSRDTKHGVEFIPSHELNRILISGWTGSVYGITPTTKPKDFLKKIRKTESNLILVRLKEKDSEEWEHVKVMPISEICTEALLVAIAAAEELERTKKLKAE